MKLGLETTDLLGHLGTAWRESIGMRYPPDRPFRLLTSAEFVGGWQPPPEHEVELRSAIHKIGQALFDLHGIEAMQQAHEEIFQEHGPVIARYIEIGFEGVGGGGLSMLNRPLGHGKTPNSAPQPQPLTRTTWALHLRINRN